jgi:hypothetical protein
MRNLLTNTAKSIKSLLPNLRKLALVAAISTSVLVGVGQKPAEAADVQFSIGISPQDVYNAANNVWRGWWSGYFTQTYFAYISSNDSRYIRQNYGSSAWGYAKRVCTDSFVNVAGQGWFVYPNSWWYINVQDNGDQYLCFFRKYTG